MYGRMQCIDLMRRLAFPLYYYLYHRRHKPLKEKVIESLVSEYKLKRLDTSELSRYKKSDTLFILGSGASINKLTHKDWDVIRNADSIGFNFWLLHDFVPTYYEFETTRDAESTQSFLHNLNLKQIKYKNIPFIMKDVKDESSHIIKKIPDNLKKNLYLSLDLGIPGSNTIQLKKSLRKIKINSIHNKLFYKKRASLSYLVLLSFIIGYRNIILCGVDLNNTKYFFEENIEYYKNQGLLIPPRLQTKSVHKTIDPDINELTIDKVILAIRDVILNEHGVKLFIGSKSSALYPRLPFYSAFE